MMFLLYVLIVLYFTANGFIAGIIYGDAEFESDKKDLFGVTISLLLVGGVSRYGWRIY